MTPAAAKVTVPRSVFFILFTISGFAGLIYESIWSHYLKLFLGHAAYSQTLVLAIFMGGMAIGARICAGYTDRWKNLLLGYAIAELAIGFLALIFHGVFVNTIAFAYEVIFPALGSPESINAVKWAIGGALILPQSILLGMTFPLMTAAIMRIYPQTPGSALSMLYFTNSFGAAVGVLASGFYLIEKVGMPGTLLTAGLMNIALALVVFAITKFSIHAPNEESSIPAAAAASERARAHPPQLLYLLLGASLLTGAASFCYEIGWIRMLSLVLGSSTHAFEIMLSAFILGIALGGLWIKRRIDSYANVIGVLALVLIAKGVLALATLPVYGMTFDAMQMTMTSLAKTEFSYGVFNLISHLISLSVMFPAAFCAGMSLPLITFALLDKGYGESSIGKVYAWNTLGAIVGVLFAVHIAMPSFGLKNLIVIAAVVDIGIAIVLGARLPQIRLHKVFPWAAGLGVLSVLSAVLLVEFDSSKMASGVYRQGRLQDPQKVKNLYHRDGKTASIDVVKDPNIQAIITNGKTDAAMSMDGDASIADESTMVLAGALPLAHKPHAKKIANIGFGSGLTTHTLLGSTSITSVDTIEIEPAMVEGARLFGDMVERAYTDPRSKIHIEDAKSFFAGRKDKYDIIVSEPSNPWVSGVSGLFSNEFYTQIKRHLQDDGVLVQWIQLYEIDIELVSSILKALGANFEDYVAYEVGLGDMVIMAVPKGKLLPLTETPFQSPLLKAQLARLGIHEVRDLEMRRIGGKKFLQHLV
ncbi:MAG: spermidine synthase, partial [Betaproteobacteria bacterium]|nr:spermidine synthase [Betaproteobacteria bacterium]